MLMDIIQPDGLVDRNDILAIELTPEFYSDFANIVDTATRGVNSDLTSLIRFNRIVSSDKPRSLPQDIRTEAFIARAGLSEIIKNLILSDSTNQRTSSDSHTDRAREFIRWVKANYMMQYRYGFEYFIGEYPLPDIGVGANGTFLVRKIEDPMYDQYKNLAKVCKGSEELLAAWDFVNSVEHYLSPRIMESGTPHKNDPWRPKPQKVEHWKPRFYNVRFKYTRDVVLFRMLHCP